MLNLFWEQPRAFHMIFMLELWERFGYYTVQGVITLYFIRYLGYSDVDSYYTFGAFSALVYGLVVVGGYLGDKILGTKRTILLGLSVLSLGYFSLAITDKEHVFLALGLICVGNGLFKANPSNLLSKCYEPGDARLHGGFTLYYMSVNLGSIVALLAGPAIASHYGYVPTYIMSAVGLILGLLNYALRRHSVAHINTAADRRKITGMQWLGLFLALVLATEGAALLLKHIVWAQYLFFLITGVVLFYYFYLMQKEEKASSKKMFVALILMLEAVIFFVLYQQMPTSLNLFAVNNVVPSVFGITLDPQSFQALNPIWIVSMGPLLAYVYATLNKRNIVVSVSYKFALGMTMCAISFLILYAARYFCNEQGMVSSGWLIMSYLFQGLGELLVSALGVAMVAELVPSSIAGFVMGIWYLTTAIAGFLGATVASYTAIPKYVKPGVNSLMIYTDVFACIGGGTLLIALFMWLITPWLNRYIVVKTSHSEERGAISEARSSNPNPVG